MRAHPVLRHVYRGAVAVVGTAIIAGGILLLPLPGPGWVIIFLGLAILGSEFTWAKRLLQFARDKVTAWTRWAARQSLPVRVLLGAGVLVIVAGVVVGYFAWQGVPSWVPYIG